MSRDPATPPPSPGPDAVPDPDATLELPRPGPEAIGDAALSAGIHFPRLWQRFVEVTKRELDKVYERLDVKFDTWYGESFYNDKLQQVYDELTAAGLAEVSQGALVVFHPEHPRFKTQPFIIRQSDGARISAVASASTSRSLSTISGSA